MRFYIKDDFLKVIWINILSGDYFIVNNIFVKDKKK